jgi:hypothetical protein
VRSSSPFCGIRLCASGPSNCGDRSTGETILFHRWNRGLILFFSLFLISFWETHPVGFCGYENHPHQVFGLSSRDGRR